MPNLKELRQAVSDLKAEGRKKFAELNALRGKASRTDADEAEIAKLDGEITALEAKVTEAQAAVEAEEKRLDRERSFAPLGNEATEGRGRSAAGDFSSNEPNPALTYGFHDMAEFAMAVKQATPGGGNMVSVDQRLVGAGPTNVQTANGTDDGFMVPPMFRDGIWELVFDMEDIPSWVDGEPTSAREVKLLADESTPWGAGGIEVRWRSEGTQMTGSKAPPPAPRSVPLEPLYAFVTADEDLLEDAPRLANRLTNKAAIAINWKIGDSIIYGDGVQKPLGWMKSPAKIAVAKKAGQAAKTIIVENVLDMYTRLLTQPGDSPFWMANRDIVPQLVTMTIGDTPMWTPPVAGLKEAPGGFLLGLPIRWSEHAETLGTEGDLQLLSPKGYYMPKKASGIRFDTSIHLYFDYGLQAFRWTFRLGGQPHLSKPVQPAKGDTSKSHFVTLATRA